MMELVLPENTNLTTQEGKYELAKVMLNAPQANAPIVHRFGPGVYIREASYSQGTLIIGQEHLSEHINMLLKGKINIINEEGNVVCLEAPYMFVAKAGSKIGYALEDVVWQNIYATNETDVEKLEATFFKTPEFFVEFVESKLLIDQASHQDDRDDFELMLKETGWSKEDVYKWSNFNDDKINLPHGSYSIVPSNSAIQGKGMFASANIKEGELIAPMRINGKRTPVGYLVNHSKNPNSIAVLNKDNDMYLVAIKEINGMAGGQLGEELTLDYRQVMLLNNLWDGEIKCQLL